MTPPSEPAPAPLAGLTVDLADYPGLGAAVERAALLAALAPVDWARSALARAAGWYPTPPQPDKPQPEEEPYP